MPRELYGPDGKFLFRGKRPGFCALCQGDKGDAFTYDVGALGPNTRFCKVCINQHGAPNLRKDANVALQNAHAKVDGITQQVRGFMRRYQERFGAPLRFGVPKKAE